MVKTDLDARFCDAAALLTDDRDGRKIGIAVSGGPDSMALLLLAHRNFPGQICAATVDHQLRPEAADEARFVADICAAREIPHYILRPASPITGNIQSSARAERYRLLTDWAAQYGCQFIATAHHAEDQLETVLMRLARGSGVSGMAGIRARNANVIRPLLEFSKAELIAICTQAGITPVSDPSNDDTDFDRVRFRQWLSLGHPMGDNGPNRTANALADATQAIEWAAAQMALDRVQRNGDSITIDAANIPTEFQRRLLVTALLMLQPDLKPRGPSIDNAIEVLNAGSSCTIGNILCKGGTLWRISKAPARRTP
jgi:tRNA(Ile)-lysidine synthase